MTYVSPDFRLVTCPADVTLVKGSHTGEHLADFLRKKATEYGVQMSTATTDSAANQIKAARLCVENNILKERLACSTHTLNLVVRKVLPPKKRSTDGEGIEDVEIPDEVDEAVHDARARAEESDDDDYEQLSAEESKEFAHVHHLIRKLRKMCAMFRKSTSLNESLVAAQDTLRKKKRLHTKHNLRLLMDCPTRWSSTYLMTKRVILLEPAINYVKATAVLSKSQKDRFLKDSDWELTHELSTLLGPFYTATKLLSGNFYCTASKVLA